MTSHVDEFQQLSKDQLEAVGSVAAAVAKDLQMIAAEAVEFSRTALETNSAYFDKLFGAKSLENAIEIQSEYAKSNYERLMTQATRVGELYAHLAKEAFKPAELAIARFQAVATRAGDTDGRNS